MNFPWLAMAMIGTAVWLGFVLHTSAGESLLGGKYSPSYAVFLSLLTVLWLGLCLWGWRHRDRLGKKLGSLLAALGITALLALLILPGTYIYLHHRSLEKSLFTPIDPQAHAFFQIEQAPEPPDTTPSTARILALGGSTTYGSSLERDQTYPAVLEQLLRQRFPATSVQVLNAGVPWHTSRHSLLRYVSRYATWRPHIIIVMHAFNDIYQTSEGRLTSGSFRSDYGHFFGALGQRVNPRDGFQERIAHLLTQNRLVKTWYSDLRNTRPPSQKPSVDLLRALPSFRNNLEQLIYRAGQDGVQVILATQPYLYRPTLSQEERKSLFYNYYYRDYAVVPAIEEQTRAMGAFNDATREIARQKGAWLLDLEQFLPKNAEFMYDDVHYTVTGAQKVAAIAVEQLPWVSLLDKSNSTITPDQNLYQDRNYGSDAF